MPHHRALVEALVRPDARVNIRARRGCISMYFYARVIAPTVYFYPTRVICNGPPSDRANGGWGREVAVAISREEKKKDRSIREYHYFRRGAVRRLPPRCGARRCARVFVRPRPFADLIGSHHGRRHVRARSKASEATSFAITFERNSFHFRYLFTPLHGSSIFLRKLLK